MSREVFGMIAIQNRLCELGITNGKSFKIQEREAVRAYRDQHRFKSSEKGYDILRTDVEHCPSRKIVLRVYLLISCVMIPLVKSNDCHIRILF